MAASRQRARRADIIAGLDWVTRESWPPLPKGCSPPLTLVDLFCSCGGLTLGAWEGARIRARSLEVRLAVELREEPLLVYHANFGNGAAFVRRDNVERLFDGNHQVKLTPTERYWKGRIGRLDLLVAGPPCQGHSDLNNRTRRHDPRNLLYLRVVRAAEVLRPKAVIIENVPAVTHDAGNVVGTAVQWLQQIGYGVSAGVIGLAQFGVPQLRKRHILIATLDGSFDLSSLADVDEQGVTAGMYLAGLENSANTNGLMSRPAQMTDANKRRVAYLFDNRLHDLPDEERPSCHRDKRHKYGSMYGRMHWERPAQTLTSGFGSMGQGRYVHPTRRRLLTPHEAARLQGLPDFFDFTPATTLSGLREMIANAVPPQFTATLVARLIDEGLL